MTDRPERDESVGPARLTQLPQGTAMAAAKGPKPYQTATQHQRTTWFAYDSSTGVIGAIGGT